MKKGFVILLALFCLIAISACGEKSARKLVLGNSAIDDLIQDAKAQQGGETADAQIDREESDARSAEETDKGGDSSSKQETSSDTPNDTPNETPNETQNETTQTDEGSSTTPNDETDSPLPPDETQPKETAPKADSPVYGSIDVDLSSMRGSIAYAQVYDLYANPSKYAGKVVKAQGPVSVYFDYDSKKYYPAVLIRDATACCATGIEFVLFGDREYPEGYPKGGDEVTVIGVFEIYYEGANRYCHLIDAVLE